MIQGAQPASIEGLRTALEGLNVERVIAPELDKMINEKNQPAATNNAQEPAKEPVNLPNNGDITPPADDTKVDSVNDGAIEINTPLFNKKVAPKEEGAEPINLDLPTEVKEMFKKSLGIEIKEGEDINKAMSSITTWRKQAQEAAKIKETAETYEKIISGLPPELYSAAQAYYNGEDWKQKIQTSTPFDFTKDVKDIPSEKLVNHYFPGKFSQDDFDTGSEALEIAIEASRARYSSDKEKVFAERANNDQRALKLRDEMVRSAQGSVQKLRQSLPDIPETSVNAIQEKLVSGDILSLFKNEDGTYAEDAAEKLAMALYGKQTIDVLLQAAENRGITKAREERLAKSSDTPSGGGGAANGQKLSPTAAKLLDELSSLNQGKTF